jgi:hypothetical protein
MLIIDIDDIFVAPSPSLYFVKKMLEMTLSDDTSLQLFVICIITVLLQVFKMSAEKFLSIASTVFLGQNRSLSQSLECKKGVLVFYIFLNIRMMTLCL